jgi:hypothetical protein
MKDFFGKGFGNNAFFDGFAGQCPKMPHFPPGGVACVASIGMEGWNFGNISTSPLMSARILREA